MTLMRVNSLCANPSEQLVELVKKNDCDGIRKLVEDNAALDLLNIEDSAINKTILHLACHDYADHVQGTTIKQLLSLGANPLYSNEEWQFKNALHFAVLGQKPEILEAVSDSLTPIQINGKANGRSALHILVKEVTTRKSTFLQCIRILIDKGLDARAADATNNTALYWAAKKKQEDIVDLLLSYDARVTEKEAKELQKLSKIPYYLLLDDSSNKSAFELLRAGAEDEFIQKLSEVKSTEEFESESYLQYACKVPLMKAVEFLILQDPNKVGRDDKTPPIEIAVKYGRYQIVEKLLKMKDIHLPPNLLSDSLTRLDFGKSKDSDFARTYHLLVQHQSTEVNSKDHFGYFPLYYAARYGGPHIVKQLLDRYASLANRDSGNGLAVSYIDYETLRQHFDNCIEAHPEDKLNKESMFITFNYTTLLPPTCNRPESGVSKICDCEGQVLAKPARHTYTKESDVVLHMSQDSDQKALLQHPLIVSFLNVKWHRVRMIFYLNLLIYSLFCFSLLTFILKSYNPPSQQSFDFWHLVLFVFAVIVSIREVFQMLLMTKDYLCNMDNYIEVILLVDVYIMLFWPSADDAIKRQLYAFAVLLAAMEMLFLLGSIPELSTYVIMLRTVSFTFFKFLMFNGILILAFAFCFYTLFRNEPNQEEEQTKGGPIQKEDDGFFTSIYSSLFKTLVMLTGEFEAGELDFNKYPITSHIIFIMFVLLIAIILLNLLNGLAVSDTQEIKNEAKLVALTARAQYIAHIESLVFAKRFWTPSNCRNDFCGCEQNGAYMKQGLTRGLMARVSISTFLNEKNELKVHPRQEGRIEIPLSLDNVGCGRRRSCKATIDNGTIKKAMQIVYARNISTINNEIFNTLTSLQCSVKRLEEKFDRLDKIVT